jgi:hypothetical protein
MISEKLTHNIPNDLAQTDRQTDTHTDRQTDTHRPTETDTDTDTDIDIDADTAAATATDHPAPPDLTPPHLTPPHPIPPHHPHKAPNTNIHRMWKSDTRVFAKHGVSEYHSSWQWLGM